jgi:hypothetical protein
MKSRKLRGLRVSLTAAILRWLEYTETRAMTVVSNEGYTPNGGATSNVAGCPSWVRAMCGKEAKA